MKDDHKIILKLFYWTSEQLQIVQTWHNGVVSLHWLSAIHYLQTFYVIMQLVYTDG